MTPIAALRTLVARLSQRTRTNAAIVVALSLLARAIGALAALTFVASFERGLLLAVLGAVVLGLERAALGRMRILVEGDLQRMSARTLLATDVLAIRSADLPLTIYEAAVHAQALVFVAMNFAIDALIVLVSFTLLGALLPMAVALALTAALLVGALALRHIGAQTRRLEGDARAAFARVTDTFGNVVSGRLEVVASAGEDQLLAELDARLDRWETLAIRSSWLGGLLTRSTMLIAALVAAGIVFVQGNPFGVADAPRLAALGALFVPSALGLALAFSGAQRNALQAAPFVGLLESDGRDERGRRGLPAGPLTIQAKELGFAYGEEEVFTKLSFETAHGVVMLGGANGAGKSTLLRLLLGLRRAQRGTLEVAGVAVSELDIRALRRATAYLPQRPFLGEPHEMIRTAFAALGADISVATMNAALASVGLAHMAERSVGELSAGQRQRLALARVLAKPEARWLLLDEPDANLDADGVAMLHTLLARWSAEGKSVVMAAHAPEFLRDAACVIDMRKP